MRIELTIFTAPVRGQQTGAAPQQGVTAGEGTNVDVGAIVNEALDEVRDARNQVSVSQEGRVVSVGPQGVTVSSQVPPVPPIPGDVIPDGAVTISVAFFIMVAAIIVGLPIARAIARRMDRAPAPVRGTDREQRAQLQRMEQALEAISVEVERITENQRFVTRLMTESAPEALLQGVRSSGGGSTPSGSATGR